MSKLMEQVTEIKRRAHVCPECKGTGNVETHPYVWLKLCGECEGKGQVEAHDIDTLVGVIERLAKPFVASHKTNDVDTAIAVLEADRLVNEGLPEEGGHV